MPQPHQARLLQEINRWATTSPHAAAVVDGENVLTYSELVSQAATFSTSLQALGAGPERYVLVGSERTVWTIAALAGVLRAGAGFLLLDERLPDRRLRVVLEATNPVAAVADHGFARRLQALGIPTRSSLPGTPTDGGVVATVAQTQAEPENAAYVVMTSGSTGTPKAVVVERRHLDAYLEAALHRLGIDASTDFASVSPLWTDLGHTAVFGALWSGGALHLVPEQVASSPSALAAQFACRPCDYLKITPSHLQALLEAEGAGGVLPRRGLILGGERLQWALADRVRRLAPAVQIFNHYGPAECTIGVAADKVLPEATRDSRTVPVGRPLHGTRILVLDRDLEPATPGAIGEIYVTGPTVARGYLDNEDATSRQFPYLRVGDLSGRFYRTGDLGRILPNGQVEVTGRVDRQVKVRGFRVEPGEVEHALLVDPRVQQAYAMGHEDEPGSVELAAFVVPVPGARLSEADLLEGVRDTLPSVTVPSRLRAVEALPRTDAGKVDEAVLASWLFSLHSERVGPAALTPTEQIVAELWASVLDHGIGRDDNIFEHGANSIAAIRFLARLHQAVQTEIPLHVVFERPTVADLARLLDDGGGSVSATLGAGDAAAPHPERRGLEGRATDERH